MMADNAITVLLVDDDDMIRHCVSAYLDDEEFTVYSAASGEEALAMIARINPVVCISDMRLTGMDGEEFIVAAHALCPATRYFLHTGMLYTLSEELEAVGLTAEDVLLKPIHDLSKLAAKIRSCAVAKGNV
jgi:DNA-binding NtrC family response regulator